MGERLDGDESDNDGGNAKGPAPGPDVSGVSGSPKEEQRVCCAPYLSAKNRMNAT